MKLSRLGSFHQSKLSFLRSFLREFKNCNSKIILSTGMSTIDDIEFALEILTSAE